LMSAEGVRLDDAAPVRVQRGRALVRRSDTVAPVVFVCEAAAGPAHVRYANLAQGRRDVVANTPSVRNARIRADPHAFVDTATEMLGELTEQVPVDLRPALVCLDLQRNRVRDR